MLQVLLTQLTTLVFHLDMASDVLTICPALQKMGITYSSLYLTVEEVDLMNTTKIILYVLAIIVIIITFFVLNNVLTLILQGRQKYMARLKILGASSAMVAIIYYTTLILSFLVAFILAVALSSLFCGYFTTVANSLLSFESAIVLRWEAVVVLFCIGLVFLSIFYLLFYRKMKKISPLSYIRSLYVGCNQFYLMRKNSVFYGLLKSNGVSNKNIFIIHFLELFLLCLFSLALGVLCSVGILFVLQYAMANAFSISISFPFLSLIWSIPLFIFVGAVLSCLLTLYIYLHILKKPPIHLLNTGR